LTSLRRLGTFGRAIWRHWRGDTRLWNKLHEGNPVIAERLEARLGILLITAAYTLLSALATGLLSIWTSQFRFDILSLFALVAAMSVIVGPFGFRRIFGAIGRLLSPVRRMISAAILQLVALPVSYASARRAVFGLQRFFWAPDVAADFVPFWIPEQFFIYEEIGPAVSGEALVRRQKWLDQVLTRVPEAAAGDALIAELLRDAAGNHALIHSAYHREPANSARIARFIAFRI
jgi:hypothetical protein